MPKHSPQQSSKAWARPGNPSSAAMARPSQVPQPEPTPGDFHNPYNFIPAPVRKDAHETLGDDHPKGHGAYHADRWSGRIAVQLTTKTPLLIPDAAKVKTDSNDHKTFPVREVNGKPYLAPTSIKGMLRSAYEAVTNSRFGVFEDHGDRLAYRMPANMGLSMVPARIEAGQVSLYTGTATIGNNGKPRGPMYAAWLPRYDRRSGQIANYAVRYANGDLPSHGQAVTAWIELYGKYRNRECTGRPIFTYWRVRSIALAGEQLGARPRPGQARGRHAPLEEPVDRTDRELIKEVDGYVYVSNRNIDTKHDERVFFSTEEPIQLDLTSELQKKWTELIKNYQETHRSEIESGQTCPPALENSVWSRHVTAGGQASKLQDKTLCYALVEETSDGYDVVDFYPVMISRGLYQNSPYDLISPSLLPATDLRKLSPADRVFGWVNQTGKGSYKGNARLHSVDCLTENAIEPLGANGVTLAILGKANPQQFRFYLQDAQAQAISKNVPKEDAYTQGQTLRGRKVYPHHGTVTDADWDVSADNANYTHSERSNQNRSITGWVKPGVTFTFSLDVTNLSGVELGALLWLLTLPEEYYHRLGGGKPLGFGSVRLSLDYDATDLRTGKEWQDFYGSLLPVESPKLDLEALIKHFRLAVQDAYGGQFAEASFIKAFLVMAKGFEDGLPIHYPRTTAEPNPNGEGFDWFVANESAQGHRRALPLLVADRGLPYVSRDNENSDGGNSGPNNRPPGPKRRVDPPRLRQR